MSHVVRKGEGAVAPFVLDVTPKSAGWDHTGLKVLELAPGASQTVTEDGHELLVLALSGSATVVVDVDGALVVVPVREEASCDALLS